MSTNIRTPQEQLATLAFATNEQLNETAAAIAAQIVKHATIVKSDRMHVSLSTTTNIGLDRRVNELSYGERNDVADRVTALLGARGWSTYRDGLVITIGAKLGRAVPTTSSKHEENEENEA